MTDRPTDPVTERSTDGTDGTPTERALRRLRDPDHPASRELAGLVAARVRDVPLAEVIDERRLATIWARAWIDLAGRADLGSWLAARIDAALAASAKASAAHGARAEEGRLRARVPVGGVEIGRALIGLPFAPTEDLVFRLVDQPAVKGLVGYVLADALRALGRRFKNPDAGPEPSPLRGLLRSVRDNLGGVAGQIVEVVREEVDGVLDGRMNAAVASLTDRALHTLARYLADPAHAEAFAEMRLGIAEEILDTPLSELADQARAVSPEAAADAVVAALRGLAGDPDLVERIATDIRRFTEPVADRTLGATLDELDLGDAWQDLATTLAEPVVRSLVATDDFADFWARLHA